ncbi:hypothetical protein DY000_02061125 [Brassica cretica]|uniref:Dynamin GTPase domain-containing protein n=1 Tax=Brassica cretica TaxID=69181 RepID=A0ABQ7B2U1_BRACR|nr:hypothetical protein DY000_02061125 [Brassica cretica]
MAGSDLKDPSFCSRQSQDSVSSGNFSNLKFTAETLEKEQASMKSDLELANASNENAKLRLMQKEDGKLSRRMESKFSPTQNLADQLTENLQHLTSQVQEENSFGVGQLLPYQILSKDGKPYIMNCETKVFAPEEITDMILTKVKEGRRVCMPPPPVPVFEDSSSDDTYDEESWLNKNDAAKDTDDEDYEHYEDYEDYEAPDEDIDKALYEGGDAAGIMMDCPDIAPLLEKLPAGFEYPFLTNEIASDLLDETRLKMVMEALPSTSRLMLFRCLNSMYIYWKKKSVHLKQYLTSRSRRKRVLVAAGEVRNQLDHLLCWAYSSSDLVSASLVLHGLEKEYFPLCPMYLCENVDPSQLESHVIEEEEHRCYGSNMHSALLYIKKYGIPKEASKEFNCMLARGVGADEKRYYISEVLRFPTLEAALMRLKTHPVGATLAMFSGCTDEGIYRGPMKEGSEYMGDHEVVMICCEVKKGEMVVKCKTSYGKKCCNRGYIYVSIEVLLILAGALRKQGAKLGDICHIRPQYLLSDFYSVEMEISSDENRAKNRQFLVEDDMEDQLSPDQNTASPVIWSSGKSSALESIVGKDFLPRGSAAVRKEIQDETDRETGRSKAISSVPIHLSIYSPDADNLTLIDLPELTKVAVNRAASDAIIISREVDPSGEITFGVLKNIDLTDKGTDAVDRLGKSSVLESIVGKDSLPRGSGIVTRRPLVLKLQTIDDGTREYAEFHHLPRKRFTDFAAVRKEIQDEIDRETGRSKAISNGQSESIVKGIENVVRSYIEKPNDIILAISPVKKYLASSDAIKISREVDPSGERTFGVLTKIDLVDYGTNAVEILEERSFKLKDPV